MKCLFSRIKIPLFCLYNCIFESMEKSILALGISAFAGLLGSCSSEGEVKSSENYIEKFEVAGYAGVPKNDQNQINLVIFEEDYEILLSVVPQIKPSQNATLSDNCKNQISENFQCTVIAENGGQRIYSVYISRIQKEYHFESWNIDNGYSIPSGLNSGWASGNAGISMALRLLGRDHTDPKSYPTRDTTGVQGRAVLMETLVGGTVFGRSIPLLSGNFILGNFNESKAITDELSATEVGQIYRDKPIAVKGYYKYKEGSGDFMNGGVPVPGRNDSCSMIVKFYRSDFDTTLTVRNIDTSDLVIAEASNNDCFEKEECQDEFCPFELRLSYTSEPDFVNHRYKLGMTFAASKNGDEYAGKIGTKLIIDEIEIIDDGEE